MGAKNDARTTPIGGVLRASHLDELPQLWNIVRGDLSFVGPRPERPEFVAKLETRIPYYEARLFIKPGVTGWAQINHRADLTDEDVAEKLQYDIYYLKNRSPILDWTIILKTIKISFYKPGIKITMKIIVTGGAGFIASHITDEYIKAGHRVVVIDNLSKGFRRNINKKARFYKADITDLAAMEKIFKKEKPGSGKSSCGDRRGRSRSVRDPIPTLTTNVLGTANVLLAFGHHGRGGAHRRNSFFPPPAARCTATPSAFR